MTRKLFLYTLIPLALNCFGWGQKGHDVTAYIAEQHLSPTAMAAVDSLLDGKSIVYWSNWLDNASHRKDYAYTNTWHYKNIDEKQHYYDVKPFKTGDVVTAIKEQSAILSDTSKSKDERALALKILVHLYGDIHQPMHLGRASDRGGNYHKVRYFKQYTNLHSVWDSKLPEYGHKWSYTEWQQQIDRADAAETAAILSVSDPQDIGAETHAITVAVYENTPEDTNIEYDYIADWTPTVEKQFLRGGLRLANLLNSIFDPDGE